MLTTNNQELCMLLDERLKRCEYRRLFNGVRVDFVDNDNIAVCEANLNSKDLGRYKFLRIKKEDV